MNKKTENNIESYDNAQQYFQQLLINPQLAKEYVESIQQTKKLLQYLDLLHHIKILHRFAFIFMEQVLHLLDRDRDWHGKN